MEGFLKELIDQSAENAKKAPGWLPLLLLCYVGSYLLVGIPGLHHIESHRELFVSGVTLILYFFGDALDKPVFKRFSPKRLGRYRRRAEDALLVKNGIYKVSKSLAIAAGKYDQSWIRVKNESSKLSRSLILPSLGAAIVLLLKNHPWLALAAVAAGFVFLVFYLRLKAWHMSDLYSLSEELILNDKYQAKDLTEKARLFFWDGELISSASPFVPRRQAVVFLHGYPFDRAMWREQIGFLNEHDYRVVAPDLCGLGKTKSAGVVTTMAGMARDVAALLDDLKIERAVICGLSMGGYVAFEFAKLFPARLKGLVLAGTRASADNEQEKQARFQQVDQMLAKGMNEIADATLPKLLSPHTLASKPEVAARVREMILRADPQGAAAAQRGMAARRDCADDLSGIDAPTLVIVGREDPIRPVADAEFMRDRIPDSRLAIIEDAAHMTNMEQPSVFNGALLEFLRSIH